MSDTIARGGIEVVAQADFSDLDRAILGVQGKLGAFKEQAAGVAQGVAGVGRGATEGLKDTDAATQRAARSMEMLAAKARLSAGEFALFKAAARGANTDALLPLAAAIDQFQAKQASAGRGAADMAQKLGLVGITANQATTAMRQLPAQFTDIFVSLASGQPALTVFLQQGGQIKDTFGGAGNALRALGSVLTPVRLALGGAAAAIVGLGLAYKQGSAEADEYRRALVLTGNAAGATVSQLQNTAEAVSRSVGTQSQAAEVVAQLAASGRVAAGDIGKLAEAAIRLERVGGPAAEETAKAFAELGKEPSKAAAKLNESTNFLTVSVYAQIKALEEQGRAAEAAALAQTSYADALKSRAGELQANLGSIERGWIAIKDAISGAKDALLGIGRAETPQQQLEALEAKLRTAEAAPEGRRSPERQRFIEQGRQQAEQLRLMILLAGEAATKEAELAAATKKGVAAIDESYKARSKSNDELKRQIEAGRDLLIGLDFKDAGFNQSFLKDMNALQAYAKAAGLSTEQLQSAIAKLIAQQPFATEAAKAEAEAQKAAADAIAKAATERQKHLEGLEKAAQAQQQQVLTLEDELYALQFGAAALYERVTLRKQEEAATLELLATKALLENSDGREYEALRARASALQTEIDLRRQIAGVTADQEIAKANAKAAADAAREWERTVDSIRDGLTDAFRRAFESGEDFGTAFAKTIGNEIKARIATALAGAMADTVLSLVGLQTAGAVANASGGASTLSNIGTAANLYAGGAKAYSWMTGTTTASTASLSAEFVAGYKGGQLAAGMAGPTTQGATGAMGAGANTSSWMSSAGWIAAAILGAMKASSDYSAGFRRDQAKDFANEIGGGGRYIIGSGGVESEWANALSKMGFSDRLADLLSGSTATAALFGYASPKISASGVTGTIGGGDFSGSMFADVTAKAGFVRKLFGGGDKTETILADLPDELGRFLDTASKGIFDKAEEYGKALGLPVDALAGITKGIKVTLTDDAEKNMQAITEALGGYGEALVAGYAEAIKPLALYGETTVQTIERVGAAIGGVNEVLNALGLTAITASVSGGEAAIALQELFGGIDGLRNAAGSYLNNFYSDAERADLTMQAIGDTLAEVGLQVPATREQFRGLVDELVNGGGLMTESGRESFAALMSVQEAFAAITPAAEEMAAELAAAIDEALPLFQSAAEVMAATLADLSEQLAGVGVNVAPDVLGSATKAQILDFAKAFVLAGDNSTEAKLAVVQVAGALAQLRDQAAESAAEVTDAFAEFRRSLMTDSEAFAESLRNISASLRAAGIEVSESALSGATLDQVQAFVEAFMQVGTASDEAKLAVIGAASALTQLAGSASAAQLDARRQSGAGGNQASIDAALRTARMNPQWDSKFAQIDAFRAAGSGVAAAWLEGTIANSIGAAPRYASQRGFGVGGGGGGGSYDGPRIGDATKVEADAWRKSIDDLIKSNDRLRGSLTDLRADLIGSELDPANPVAKYESARTEVERLARMASTGDAASVDAFAQQAREFLSLSRDFNASSGAYAADFERVSALLASVDATLAKMNDVAKATLMLNRDGFGELAEQNDAQIELNRMRAGAAEVQRQRHVE